MRQLVLAILAVRCYKLLANLCHMLHLIFFASSQAYVPSVSDCTFLVIVTTASVFLYNLEELTGKTMAEPF